jgi:hypothetical protein
MILSLLALSFNTLSTHALPWAMKQSKRIIKPREGISNGSLLCLYTLLLLALLAHNLVRKKVPYPDGYLVL